MVGPAIGKDGAHCRARRAPVWAERGPGVALLPADEEFFQAPCVARQLMDGDAGVHLCGACVGVSQHSADAFDGYAGREGHRGKGVACQVEVEVAAGSGRALQPLQQAVAGAQVGKSRQQRAVCWWRRGLPVGWMLQMA